MATVFSAVNYRNTGGEIRIVPTSQTITSRVVSDAVHEQFASLCGDRNPMHMDVLAARRTQAGLRVVHGVHTLLWALESLVASGHIVSQLVRIRVKFLKWVYLGDEAVLTLPSVDTIDPTRVQIEVLGLAVCSAELTYGKLVYPESAVALACSPRVPLSSPLDLSFAELINRSGDAFTASAEDVQRVFPLLSAAIGAVAVSEIASCSYIVGMEAPGLHSTFSKLDLVFIRSVESAIANQIRTGLHYEVSYHDQRFSKLRITVVGAGIHGILEAFMRDRPVEQPTMNAVASRVEALEFAGMRALIVGGSRGLGELTAKLIAAGGGSATITYAVGQLEAEHLAKEIREWGGLARILQYDVRQSSADQLELLPEKPTHLFYFATGTIYKPKIGLLSPSALSDFLLFYVHGFYDLCTTLLNKQLTDGSAMNKLFVLYPSTSFLEERPAGMTEYAMIKAAGEQLCVDMNTYLPGIKILAPRLPKLQTDQTASLLPERPLDTVDTLLPLLRQMIEL